MLWVQCWRQWPLYLQQEAFDGCCSRIMLTKLQGKRDKECGLLLSGVPCCTAMLEPGSRCAASACECMAACRACSATGDGTPG